MALAMISQRCCPVDIVLALFFLFVSLRDCHGQASCKVNPTEYVYRGDYVTVSEGSAVQCSADNTRPNYVRCTGETLRLSDGDLGPDCAITGQEERFYVWERSLDSGNNPIKPRLLLTFEGNISPSVIKLHYFSDPSNGRGLPTLNVYPNIDNPWETLTTDRIATISALLKDVSEPPHRETISVNTMGQQLHTVLILISFPTGGSLASFYLSEIEAFTCPQESTSSLVKCDTTTSVHLPVLTAITSTTPIYMPTPTPSRSQPLTTFICKDTPIPTNVADVVPRAPDTSECSCRSELAWILVYVFASLFITLLCLVIMYCGWIQTRACWHQRQQVQIQQQPPAQEDEDSKIKSCDVEQPQVHHEYAVLTYLPATPEPVHRYPNPPEVYTEPHIYESLSPYHSNKQSSQL